MNDCSKARANLDALVSKKDPSKSDCSEYEKNWLELANSIGYEPDVEKYLFDGIKFCGARGLKQYIVEQENSAEIVNAVVNGQKFVKQRDIAFKIVIHLIALLIAEQSDSSEKLLCPLICKLPSLSKNYDNKIRGDAPRTVQKYFIGELLEVKSFPKFEDLDIESKFVAEFRELMIGFIDKIDKDSLHFEVLRAINAVREWLQSDAPQVQEQVAFEEAERAEKSEKFVVTDESKSNVVGDARDDSCERSLLVDLAKVVESLRDTSSALAKDILLSHDEVFWPMSQLKAVQQQVAELQGKLSEKEKAIAAIEYQLQESSLVNSSLQEANLAFKRRIEELEAIISEQIQEIARLNEARDVLSRNRTRQSEDNMRKLASKLKAEYMDFLSVDPNKSTGTDLGDNMRDQLMNVFRILIESGIPLG